MMDPRTQYLVYKEQENERMTQIERMQEGRQNGTLAESGPSWTSVVGQWLKEKVFSSEKVIAGGLPKGHHSAA